MEPPVVEKLKEKLETLRRRARILKDRVDNKHGSIGSLAYDAAEYDALVAAISIAEWYGEERKNRR